MALKENYKNYIPDSNGRKYSITEDAQGFMRIQDQTNYTQVGDNFGANDINAITHEVNNINTTIQDIDDKFESEIIVTIPKSTGSNYTLVTDSKGGTYYTIEINVTGMTPSYVGTKETDYVRPTPFTVEDNDAIFELFNTILDIQSLQGKIKVYIRELPTSSFGIYLYGV